MLPDLFAALRGHVLLAHHAPIEIGFLERAAREAFDARLPLTAVDTMELQHRLVVGDHGEVRPDRLRLDDARRTVRASPLRRASRAHRRHRHRRAVPRPGGRAEHRLRVDRCCCATFKSAAPPLGLVAAVASSGSSARAGRTTLNRRRCADHHLLRLGDAVAPVEGGEHVAAQRGQAELVVALIVGAGGADRLAGVVGQHPEGVFYRPASARDHARDGQALVDLEQGR